MLDSIYSAIRMNLRHKGYCVETRRCRTAPKTQVRPSHRTFHDGRGARRRLSHEALPSDRQTYVRKPRHHASCRPPITDHLATLRCRLRLRKPAEEYPFFTRRRKPAKLESQIRNIIFRLLAMVRRLIERQNKNSPGSLEMKDCTSSSFCFDVSAGTSSSMSSTSVLNELFTPSREVDSTSADSLFDADGVFTDRYILVGPIILGLPEAA